MSQLSASRIKWIDILKGLGIIFLVFSHLLPHGFTGDPSIDRSFMIGYLYSFHMPLFFFASGYTFSLVKYNSFHKFLISRIKSIIIPYTTLFLLSLIYFGWMHLRGIVGVLDPFVVLKAFFYADGNHLAILNMSLWFLPCLFLAQMLCYLPIKNSGNLKVLLGAWIGFTIAGAMSSLLDTHDLPWTAGGALNATSLMLLGFIFRQYEQLFWNKLRLNSRLVAFSVAFVGLYLFLINGRPGMAANYYGDHYILFYFSVLCSLFFYIYLSKRLEGSDTLAYLGRNSLIIFGLHGLILSFWENVNFYEKFSIKYNTYLDGLSFVLFSTVLVFVSSLIFIELFNRYFPFLLGKWYSKKT